MILPIIPRFVHLIGPSSSCIKARDPDQQKHPFDPSYMANVVGSTGIPSILLTGAVRSSLPLLANVSFHTHAGDLIRNPICVNSSHAVVDLCDVNLFESSGEV